MPRQIINAAYKEEVRLAYLGAKSTDERKKIISAACKESGYTYGGLMRALDMKVRPRSLSENEALRVENINMLGKLVWDYQIAYSNGRLVNSTVAIRVLKEQGLLPEEVTYHQISSAIRRQRLKNKSESYYTRFERSEPLDMIQMDFTRSIHFEHIRKNGESLLRLTHKKGANAKQSRVWIAVAIDDSTRVAYARYYLAKGESSRLARNFLLKVCKAKQRVNTDTGEIIPLPLLQGQPKDIYTDRGSAFRNTSFMNGVRKLGITHILGSTVTDTQGNKGTASNKQARGKVERMIRFLKEDFETELFLTFEAGLQSKYKNGTTFTLMEANQLLQKWLIKVNTSSHPDLRSQKRWNLFHPVLDKALYPPENAILFFSNTITRKVNRRQVRTDNGIYCKVPHEINNGDVIEIIIAGDNYYTILNGKRILLEVIPLRKRNGEPQTAKSIVKEHDDDYLEGLQLRTRLNKEIESRTRQEMNLGSLTPRFSEMVREFTSQRRSVQEVKSFTSKLLIKVKVGNEYSIYSKVIHIL
jgi:transposase InsO family protein